MTTAPVNNTSFMLLKLVKLVICKNISQLKITLIVLIMLDFTALTFISCVNPHDSNRKRYNISAT